MSQALTESVRTRLYAAYKLLMVDLESDIKSGKVPPLIVGTMRAFKPMAEKGIANLSDSDAERIFTVAAEFVQAVRADVLAVDASTL